MYLLNEVYISLDLYVGVLFARRRLSTCLMQNQAIVLNDELANRQFSIPMIQGKLENLHLF